MFFLQIIIIALLLLLLVRSINHDSRMERLEKFIKRLVSSVKDIDERTPKGIFTQDQLESFEEDVTQKEQPKETINLLDEE